MKQLDELQLEEVSGGNNGRSDEAQNGIPGSRKDFGQAKAGKLEADEEVGMVRDDSYVDAMTIMG